MRAAARAWILVFAVPAFCACDVPRQQGDLPSLPEPGSVSLRIDRKLAEAGQRRPRFTRDAQVGEVILVSDSDEEFFCGPDGYTVLSVEWSPISYVEGSGHGTYVKATIALGKEAPKALKVWLGDRVADAKLRSTMDGLDFYSNDLAGSRQKHPFQRPPTILHGPLRRTGAERGWRRLYPGALYETDRASESGLSVAWATLAPTSR